MSPSTAGSTGTSTTTRRLANEWNCQTGKEARENIYGVQRNCVNWPALAELRAKFEAKYGKQQWTHGDVTAWPGSGRSDPEDTPF